MRRAVDTQGMEQESVPTGGAFRLARGGAALAIGAAVTSTVIGFGLEPALPLGVAFGAIGAVAVQRVYLSWFASTISRTEGTAWLARLPATMQALFPPLSEIGHLLERRQAVLDEMLARQQLRDMSAEKMELQMVGLEQALDDSRADVAQILATLDRALVGAPAAAVLRGELARVRELVRLSAYADLPNGEVAVGDVVAALAGDLGVGRLGIDSALPVLNAPYPLVETMVGAALRCSGSLGAAVRVGGGLDGAMAVLTVAPGCGDWSTVEGALLRRSTAILGGDVTVRDGVTVIVVPNAYRPGVRAVRGRPHLEPEVL